MATYMLLLRGDTTRSLDQDLSPADVQSIIERYVQWRTSLQANDHYVASDKLKHEPTRTLATVEGTVRVMDGPYSEAKEVVAGYFLIEAADMAEVESIARSCPHLAYGGTIEIREIEPRMREEREARSA